MKNPRKLSTGKGLRFDTWGGGVVKQKKRLKTLNDVRVFLAGIINDLNQGLIDESRAKSFGYLCNVLAGIVKDSDLESRIEKLEKQFEVKAK